MVSAGLAGEGACGGSGSRDVGTCIVSVIGSVGGNGCGWGASFLGVMVVGLAVRLMQEVPIMDTLDEL